MLTYTLWADVFFKSISRLARPSNSFPSSSGSYDSNLKLDFAEMDGSFK